MILQSHNSYNTLGTYDPVTGAIESYDRNNAKQELVVGIYDFVDGEVIALYWDDGELWLQINARRMSLAAHTVSLCDRDGHRVLQVARRGAIVAEKPYPRPTIDPPLSDDPTPFVEEEHFDFGLFLVNVANDPARQSRFYRSWSGSR